MWQRKVPADDSNRITVSCNSVLVRTGKQTVLIETGIGNKLSDKTKSFFLPEQKLMDNLHEAGTSPEEINVVINSHLHFDHCGWNTVYKDGAAVATFPNARYFAPKGEWEHGKLQTERDRISYISDNYDPLIRSRQMTLLGGNQEQEIIPGISVGNGPDIPGTCGRCSSAAEAKQPAISLISSRQHGIWSLHGLWPMICFPWKCWTTASVITSAPSRKNGLPCSPMIQMYRGPIWIKPKVR